MGFYQENKKLCIFTAIWFIFMIFLSHQPGPDTAKTSGWLANIIARYIGMNAQLVHEFIRHAAHIVLYMILAMDLGLLLRQAGCGWFWILVLVCCIAAGDEGTKPLIAGRHCELVDIMRNCVGNIIGLVMAGGIRMLTKH